MLNWFVTRFSLLTAIEANRLSIYLIQTKDTMEQTLSQSLEIRDLSNEAAFPYSSLGAGLVCMFLDPTHVAA